MSENIKNNDKANINWYPGHMSKAKRLMSADLKLIDVLIELVDARIPEASRNPDINKMANGKARVILLNKSDLADPAVTARWAEHYQKNGYFVISVDSRNKKTLSKVKETVIKACAPKIERDRKKGIKNRPVRAMICGIPNVGKSTFINSFVGKTAAKTGNKPGVTKGNQWIRIDNNIELLDTPGILWPKFEEETGKKLAFIGSINDNILIPSEMAYYLYDYLTKLYPGVFEKHYELEEPADKYDAINKLAVKRGCLIRGGEADVERAARLFIDDFRNCKLGRMSLETPEEF